MRIILVVYPCPQLSVKYSAQAFLHYSVTKHHTTLRSEIFATVKIHKVVCWFIKQRCVVSITLFTGGWSSSIILSEYPAHDWRRISTESQTSRVTHLLQIEIYCALLRRTRLSCLPWAETFNTRDDVGGKQIYPTKNMSQCHCTK